MKRGYGVVLFRAPPLPQWRPRRSVASGCFLARTMASRQAASFGTDSVYKDAGQAAAVRPVPFAGSAIIVSPRASGSTGFDGNNYGVSDFAITNNIFRRGTGFWRSGPGTIRDTGTPNRIFAWMAISSFSALPLRVSVAPGLVLMFFGFGYFFYALYQAMITHD